MKTSNAILLGLAGCGLAALGCYATSERLSLKTYPIYTGKVKTAIKILQISDLHSSRYGSECSELMDAVTNISPDIVVMTGDILDDRAPNGGTFKFLKKLASLYPCYYVSGNHEIYTHLITAIKEKLVSYGIKVLEGECEALEIFGEKICIGGVDDPTEFPDKHGRLWEDQLVDCAKDLDGESFSILLSHRPEQIGYYEETPFDLVLTGHAHGGQVIVPHLINGLYAPHQGFLPKYAGGEYIMANGGRMVVSRGLSRLVRPRVFNRPELVLVTLLPSGEDE